MTMRMLFNLMAVLMAVGTVTFLWSIEKQVRAWPQPNWTTPTRANALFVLVQPIAFALLFLATIVIVIIGTHDTADSRSAPPAIALITFVPAMVINYLGPIMAMRWTRNVPTDEVTLRTWIFGQTRNSGLFGRTSNSERATLGLTLWMANQSTHSIGLAAAELGLPPRLANLVRYVLLSVALALLFTGPFQWAF